jgi:hypothetical protein
MNCRTLLIPRGSHISKASQQQLKSQPALTIPCGPVVKTELHATHLPQLHPPIYHSTHHVPLPLPHTLPLLHHTWRKCRHSASLKYWVEWRVLMTCLILFQQCKIFGSNLIPICDSIEPTNPVIENPQNPFSDFGLKSQQWAESGLGLNALSCDYLASHCVCWLATQYQCAVSIPFCKTPFGKEKHHLKVNLA